MIVVDPEGHVVRHNPAASRILGRNLADAPQEMDARREWLGYRHADGTPYDLAELPVPRALRGERVDDEIVLVHHQDLPEGRLLNVNARAVRDEHGEVRWGVAVFRDVTDARRAVTALRRSEENLRAIIEGAPFGIAVCRDAEVFFVNPALQHLLGYASPAELLAADPASLVAPDSLEPLRACLASAVDGRASSPCEVRLTSRDGDRLTAEVTALPTLFDGRPAIVVTAQDITERRRIEQELRAAERLASVGTLAAGIAHEINNPLAYVVHNLEFLFTKLDQVLEGLSPRERHEVCDAVNDAWDGVRRVQGIIRDVKTFSHVQPGRPTPVDLRKALQIAINLTRNEVRHRARLEIRHGRIGTVMANEGQLAQVFVNLLVNAAQALPEGHAEAHRIRVRTGVRNGRVFAEIDDTGTGIPDDVLRHVFDPFFTTKEPGEGTGLGLTICHAIVTSYGGTLELLPSPLGGTRVRVELPAARPTARRSVGASESQPSDESRKDSGRVLVIDDDTLVARSLARILRPHDVTLAADGRDGIQRCRDQDFDVILCDLMMPDMDGIEVYGELARSRPGMEARMVFMTGGAFTTRAQEFLDEVPNERLDKPFSRAEVRSLVRRMCDAGETTGPDVVRPG